MALGHRASRSRPVRACRRGTTQPILSLSSLFSLLISLHAPEEVPDIGNRSPALKRNIAIELPALRPPDRSTFPDPLSSNNKCARNQRPATVETTMKDISGCSIRRDITIPEGYSLPPVETRWNNDGCSGQRWHLRVHNNFRYRGHDVKMNCRM